MALKAQIIVKELGNDESLVFILFIFSMVYLIVSLHNLIFTSGLQNS